MELTLLLAGLTLGYIIRCNNVRVWNYLQIGKYKVCKLVYNLRKNI